MTAHSTIVGGSTAGRLITCPGSYRLINSIPDLVDVPTRYAAEGTVLHGILADMLQDRLQVHDVEGVYQADGYDIPVSNELIIDTIRPCLDFLETELSDATVFFIEKKLAFPRLKDVFGTCDLIADCPDRVAIVDWKFGAGVQVVAENPDGSYNSQLAFYACAARAAYQKLFAGKRVDAYIVQPRGQREPDAPLWSMTSFSKEDLDDFELTLDAAVKIATQPGEDAYLQGSKHCRWCPARPVCPEFSRPLIDVDFDVVVAGPLEASQPLGDTLKYTSALAAALNLAPRLELFVAEVRRQAQLFLEAGGTIEGWKLVDKRRIRRWMDEVTADVTLRKLGLETDDIYVSKLVSPAQAEKALKPLGKKLPDDLVVAESSGMTLAPEADRRSEKLPSAALLDDFQFALEDFGQSVR